MQRSVAACLASILELDVAEVPVPDEGHPQPWTVWRNWLGQRGLGLIAIADPASFDWPGPWLAMLRAVDGEGCIGAVAFGAPPGLAWSPKGGPETFDRVDAGYVIAPADVALWAPASAAAPRGAGTVAAIAVAPEAEASTLQVGRATARAGRGLEGDRYFHRRGTFSNVHGRGHDLTLIEAEVLDSLELPAGRLTPEDARRNIVTRGIDLNALVGEHLRVGQAECLGQRLCEPCAHLERLTAKIGKTGTLRRSSTRAACALTCSATARSASATKSQRAEQAPPAHDQQPFNHCRLKKQCGSGQRRWPRRRPPHGGPQRRQARRLLTRRSPRAAADCGRRLASV